MKLMLTALGLFGFASLNFVLTQDENAKSEADTTLELSIEPTQQDQTEQTKFERAIIDLTGLPPQAIDVEADVSSVRRLYLRDLMTTFGQEPDDEFLLDLTFTAESQMATVLGVHVRRPGETLRSQLQIDEGMGLVIDQVVGDSAAADAKLQTHDVIIAFDRQWLVNEEQLTTLVRNREPGDEVTLTIIRGGQKQQVDVVLKKGAISSEIPEHTDLSAWHPGVKGTLDHSHPAFSRCTDCHVAK